MLSLYLINFITQLTKNGMLPLSLSRFIACLSVSPRTLWLLSGISLTICTAPSNPDRSTDEFAWKYD